MATPAHALTVTFPACERMEPQQIHKERWIHEECETGKKKRTSCVEAAREFVRDEQSSGGYSDWPALGPDNCGRVSEASPRAARARQRTATQQQQPQLHLRMQIKPRRTSIGSARLEHLPLPPDPESPLKGCEQLAKAHITPSMWTNLLVHARRSLPFLGGDGLEGPLPPTPKSAVYNGHQIHQLGCSLLGFIPTAWDAVQSNCWRKTHITPAAELTSAEMHPDGGSGGCSSSTMLLSPRRGATRSLLEAGDHQDCGESAAQQGEVSAVSSAHINSEKKAYFRKWRSRRVTFDASDLTALLLQCLRRRLSAMGLLLVSCAFSLLLLYYSLTSLLNLLTEAIAEHSQHFVSRLDRRHGPSAPVTLKSSTWEPGSQPSSAELQLASATSLQLQDLQNLRQQMQKELKDLQDYREQLHLELMNDPTATREQIKDKVRRHDGHVSNVIAENVKVQENAQATGAREHHREVGEGWKESLFALKAQVKDLIRNDARIIADVEGLRKRLEASATYEASTALEELKVEAERIIKEFHSIFNEEERIDWALESLGASIVMPETVSSLALSTVSWGSKISSYLEELVEHDQQPGVGGGAGRIVKKPNIVLQPDTHPGNCYPFYGEKGNITILLPTSIFVTAVAVDGVASKQFTASTPRKFSLWGFEDSRATPALQETVLQSSATNTRGRGGRTCSGSGRSEPCSRVEAKVELTQHSALPSGASWWESARRVLQWIYSLLKSPARIRHEWEGGRVSARKFKKVHLGDYELLKPQRLSTFELHKKHEAPVRKVTFEFLSNFGHPYTCVYRLRVHGDKVKMSTLPLPFHKNESITSSWTPVEV